MKKTLFIVVTLVIVPLFCLAQDEATTKEVELPAAGMLKSLISKDEQKKIVKLIPEDNTFWGFAYIDKDRYKKKIL